MFKKFGVEISMLEARGPMGLRKDLHINYMNINTLDEEATLSEEEIGRRLAYSRDLLIKCGAHYVINEFTELPAAIDDINQRLARGKRP